VVNVLCTDAGPEVADLRRSGGRGVDREHEHGAGWQQEAVPDEWRDHPTVADDELDLWANGPRSCFAGHRTALLPLLSATVFAFTNVLFSVSWFSFIVINLLLFYGMLVALSDSFCFQCFNTVGWASGRTSCRWKIHWWGAGMVVCLERGAHDLHMVWLMPLPPDHFLLH